jgi:hypothetical protein
MNDLMKLEGKIKISGEVFKELLNHLGISQERLGEHMRCGRHMIRKQFDEKDVEFNYIYNAIDYAIKINGRIDFQNNHYRVEEAIENVKQIIQERKGEEMNQTKNNETEYFEVQAKRRQDELEKQVQAKEEENRLLRKKLDEERSGSFEKSMTFKDLSHEIDLLKRDNEIRFQNMRKEVEQRCELLLQKTKNGLVALVNKTSEKLRYYIDSRLKEFEEYLNEIGEGLKDHLKDSDNQSSGFEGLGALAQGFAPIISQFFTKGQSPMPAMSGMSNLSGLGNIQAPMNSTSYYNSAKRHTNVGIRENQSKQYTITELCGIAQSIGYQITPALACRFLNDNKIFKDTVVDESTEISVDDISVIVSHYTGLNLPPDQVRYYLDNPVLISGLVANLGFSGFMGQNQFGFTNFDANSNQNTSENEDVEE